jgi:hypothetical protein
MNDNIPHDMLYLNITTFLHDNKTRKIASTMIRKLSETFYTASNNRPMAVIFMIAPTEIHAMARFNQSTFASIVLTRDDEKKFTQWVTKENITSSSALQSLLGDGFKVSCSWVVDQNSFCFSVIGTDSTKNHKGMVMTTWSDDLDEVMCLAAYKHYAVCSGGEWPTQKDGQRWG